MNLDVINVNLHTNQSGFGEEKKKQQSLLSRKMTASCAARLIHGVENRKRPVPYVIAVPPLFSAEPAAASEDLLHVTLTSFLALRALLAGSVVADQPLLSLHC